jgi:hypothetical protein
VQYNNTQADQGYESHQITLNPVRTRDGCGMRQVSLSPKSKVWPSRWKPTQRLSHSTRSLSHRWTSSARCASAATAPQPATTRARRRAATRCAPLTANRVCCLMAYRSNHRWCWAAALPAMQKLRIVTLGVSGGRSLTRPFRDARRSPSKRV